MENARNMMPIIDELMVKDKMNKREKERERMRREEKRIQ